MKIASLSMMSLLALLAPALASQDAQPKPGDLIPRTGTIAYMISDHPDALYRLFGRDAKKGWKLRSWANEMILRDHEEGTESDGYQRDKAIADYVFGSYESLERVEIGLLDATLDGPKYLVVLKTKKGESINAKPDFLADFLAESKEYKGVTYYLYRAPKEESSPPKEGGDRDKDPGDEPDSPDMDPPQPDGPKDSMYGMDRFYVASTPTGLLISNFETSIREAVDKLATRDYSEALSGREEFASWMSERKPHDLSVFIIGREIQNAIERVLPSEEQAGMDAEGVYNEIDKWFQFREYKWIVFDADYDEAARGITVAASFRTRRPTRLLEKLAIEPADFKLLKYVPAGPILTAGMQLGDAKTTFNNLKELAFDVEKWAKEIEDGLRGGGAEPPMPPDEGMEPKSVLPGDWLKMLQDDGSEAEASKVEEALAELEEMLGQYGTSTESILAVLGTEVVVFTTPSLARARASGKSGLDAVMESSDIGIAIHIKDIAAAKAILAIAREKDPEGAFRGFTEITYQGKQIQISEEHPYGYAFTDDALLILVALGAIEDDATQPVIAGLKAMIDASARTVTGAPSFVKNGSKFIEFDFGAANRLTSQLKEDLSRRLDRYAEAPIDKEPTDLITDMTVSLRLKEQKDGVELAIRVAGLPDFGQFLDGDAALFGGVNSKRNAYNYTEDNFRTLGAAMRRRVDAGEALDLNAMLKSNEIRKGTLQTPFDARWKGGFEKLGWTTLDQVTRDKDGNLPDWVDAEAAALIESNEKDGFASVVLAKGDLAAWLKDWKTGFIVAYQEKADTLGGHVVLYADGQIGWLNGAVLQQALDLNAKGEAVPAEESWRDPQPPKTPRDEGDRMDEDDPWFPGGK